MITAKELNRKAKIAKAEKQQKIINEVTDFIETKVAPRLIKEAECGNFACQFALNDLKKEYHETFTVLLGLEGYQVTVNSVGLANITW